MDMDFTKKNQAKARKHEGEKAAGGERQVAGKNLAAKKTCHLRPANLQTRMVFIL